MMKKLSLSLFLFIISTIALHAQNYIDYNKVIVRIDEDIIAEEYETALDRLDSLYNQYDFIFARHCFKALQISCRINDSVSARKWLEKTLLGGVPRWMARMNDVAKKVFEYDNCKVVVNNYDSLRSQYFSSINLEIAHLIDSLFTIDQAYTAKVNDGFILTRHTCHYLRWRNNNKRQFEIIDSIIDQYGFPGEQLIGLPTSIKEYDKGVKNFTFYGPRLMDSRAYIMLIHYYSDARPDINEKLMTAVRSGQMMAHQYGAINDFMAMYNKKKYGEFQHYNAWHKEKDESKLPAVEEARAAIGLNTLENDERNRQIWLDSRKKRNANNWIILE